ncbi:MAG TPA: sulfatase-like hydrolase/transferase, partial [Polyangiaceae bacterium]
TLAFGVAGAALGIASRRFPRLARFFALFVACALLAWLDTLPDRGKSWLRFSIDLALLGASGAALEGSWKNSLPARTSFALLAAVVLAVPFGVLVRPVRGVVYEYASHARPLVRWASELGRRHPELGNVPCDGARRPPLAHRAPSPLSAGARGADVLFVSLDAMRWDHADSVPSLWRELGPHVTFTRAVSPAPRTEHACAALLRGVPSRQVPNRESARALPTIAEILAKHGYRTVQVPTHRYFGPGRWPNAGFELALTPEFPETKRRRIVPADSALNEALDIARTTPKPLLLWVHLMEGHEPYRWRGGQGPASPEAQRRAFRDIDARVARFVREYRALRAERPIVIAVFGDHGEEFGEHGGHFHSTRVYAEQVRVAFALAAPGLPASRVDAPVSLASLPATLLDLLDLPLQATFTEPSLLGCIAARGRCPTVAVSQMIVFGRWIGYTFERHRLVVDPEHDIERVYDSTSDPLEKHDLAPAEPALLDALRDRARAFDHANCVALEPG